ncbi:MAG TPA: D-aminoacyl-tRNA deacylase [Candidatus Sphingobacterium stercoripullorum]|uniref:D-aminoacyl-tRNA deacylase n=1 Tax=Candidatus Sphingobacterium stercoripullorum TaxID=2838759 RepID=A0A9D1W811_9SPHI|nr:D-tyrosyl-tRNA(Tyr) deacylase [Candidatus Sphingobacterium stercoripullorum]HLR50172.1 D-aminoacyl-tRNA deacylase [Candidatus Sphingobacterium stercoripullorum]
MRAVIQRVIEASCKVDEETTGSINQGLLIFLGVQEEDTDEDIEWLSNKIVNLRIFSDDQGKMNKSIQEIRGEILLISQFTLFALTKKGNRPSFIHAAKPQKALLLYNKMSERLSVLLNQPVATGKFGADMKIKALNDGPVTIIMNTKDKDNF